jgi:hypothetical protein
MSLSRTRALGGIGHFRNIKEAREVAASILSLSEDSTMEDAFILSLEMYGVAIAEQTPQAPGVGKWFQDFVREISNHRNNAKPSIYKDCLETMLYNQEFRDQIKDLLAGKVPTLLFYAK